MRRITRWRNRRATARTREYRVTVAWLEAAAVCADDDELGETLGRLEAGAWPGHEDEALTALMLPPEEAT